MNFYATCDNDGTQGIYFGEKPRWEELEPESSYGGFWYGQEDNYVVPPGTFDIGRGEMTLLAITPLDGKTCRCCGNQDLSVEQDPDRVPRYYVYCHCCESRGPAGCTEKMARNLYRGNAV